MTYVNYYYLLFYFVFGEVKEATVEVSYYFCAKEHRNFILFYFQKSGFRYRDNC